MATYKAVIKPTLDYASSIWSLMAFLTSINRLQVMQNAALIVCTGCTHNTNILVQHLHHETSIHPIQKHLQLHASQVRQKAQYLSHPQYRYTTHNTSQRLIKPTTFKNCRYTTNIPIDPCTVTTADKKQTYATSIQVLFLSTLLQETITQYCAHSHRKSAALKKTYPGTRVVP